MCACAHISVWMKEKREHQSTWINEHLSVECWACSLVTGAQRGEMFLGRQPICLSSDVLSRKGESKRYFPAMLKISLWSTFGQDFSRKEDKEVNSSKVQSTAETGYCGGGWEEFWKNGKQWKRYLKTYYFRNECCLVHMCTVTHLRKYGNLITRFKKEDMNLLRRQHRQRLRVTQRSATFARDLFMAFLNVFIKLKGSSQKTEPVDIVCSYLTYCKSPRATKASPKLTITTLLSSYPSPLNFI